MHRTRVLTNSATSLSSNQNSPQNIEYILSHQLIKPYYNIIINHSGFRMFTAPTDLNLNHLCKTEVLTAALVVNKLINYLLKPSEVEHGKGGILLKFSTSEWTGCHGEKKLLPFLSTDRITFYRVHLRLIQWAQPSEKPGSLTGRALLWPHLYN